MSLWTAIIVLVVVALAIGSLGILLQHEARKWRRESISIFRIGTVMPRETISIPFTLTVTKNAIVVAVDEDDPDNHI